VSSWGRAVRAGSAFVAVGLLVAGCAQPVDSPGAPTDGLHACPSAGSLIGVFTGQDPTPAPGDGPDAMGSDTWGLQLNGTVRRLTDDGVHPGAVISPDGRSVYQLRSSGRVLGNSLEAPSVVEQLDVRTGEVAPVAELPSIVDLAVSGDGRRLAAAHMVQSRPDTGLDVNSVAVVDLAFTGTPTELSRAPDVASDVYSVVNEVALDASGDRVAYALAVEVRHGLVINTLRLRDLATDVDTVVYTAAGSEFVADVAWSPDDATILATIRYQQAGDGVESPARFRTLRVDAASGRATLDDGHAQDFTPRSVDGSTLMGLAPTPGAPADPRGRALISWERRRGASAPQSIGHGASGISIASCSYR
jgi:hypothetical protein